MKLRMSSSLTSAAEFSQEWLVISQSVGLTWSRSKHWNGWFEKRMGLQSFVFLFPGFGSSNGTFGPWNGHQQVILVTGFGPFITLFNGLFLLLDTVCDPSEWVTTNAYLTQIETSLSPRPRWLDQLWGGGGLSLATTMMVTMATRLVSQVLLAASARSKNSKHFFDNFFSSTAVMPVPFTVRRPSKIRRSKLLKRSPSRKYKKLNKYLGVFLQILNNFLTTVPKIETSDQWPMVGLFFQKKVTAWHPGKCGTPPIAWLT